MVVHDALDIIVERNQFLQRVVEHHQRGDHYPHPQVISRELRLTPAQTDAVLSNLRTLRWIADSPYGSERLRLTPRCWSVLRRALRDPDDVLALTSDDVYLAPYSILNGQSPPLLTGQREVLPALAK